MIYYNVTSHIILQYDMTCIIISYWYSKFLLLDCMAKACTKRAIFHRQQYVQACSVQMMTCGASGRVFEWDKPPPRFANRQDVKWTSLQYLYFTTTYLTLTTSSNLTLPTTLFARLLPAQPSTSQTRHFHVAVKDGCHVVVDMHVSVCSQATVSLQFCKQCFALPQLSGTRA